MHGRDFYLQYITSEHRSQPQFSAVVKAITEAFVDGLDVTLSMIDKFDLDQAQGDQLNSIGLWVGMFRGVSVPITGVYFTWDTPQPDVAPTLTNAAGGALGATTYYVKYTLLSAAGESLPSPEANRAVPANNVLKVTSPPVTPSVTSYNVYVSTATGTETKQNTVAIPIGTDWTEPTTGLIAGAAQPTASVGTPAIGWNNGYWQGPFDPSTGIEALDDATYRTLIRAKIAANMWDGTLGDMQTVWDYVFGPGVVSVQDNQDMTITLVYDSLQLNTVTKALLTQGRFPLKPAGVRITYTALSGAPLFSWDLNTPKFQGWNGASVWAAS